VPAELEALAEQLGQPRYRGRQLALWLFRKGVLELEAMSDLPREFRQRLAAETFIGVPEIERRTLSEDGSQKFVLRLSDGFQIHSVLMPDADRLTLCLSTQVGCGFACAFCFTGTMGLRRNLTGGEIVGQLAAVSSTLPAGVRVTHLVYMGMGEPLANYEATVKSLRLLIDPHAFGYSPRRITVSTVGLVSGIRRLANENLKVNLAISLHATTNPVRSRLMPVNRGWRLEELLAACRSFPLPVRQRMTFEYVLLHEVNDSQDDALRLARLFERIRAKVNLIPFNDWEGAGFQRPPLSRILAFQKLLLERGVTATIRWSKGEDIGAACGQLNEPLPLQPTGGPTGGEDIGAACGQLAERREAREGRQQPGASKEAIPA
jgi:23S rRNA (adenine2503-C2)-methyltransferase